VLKQHAKLSRLKKPDNGKRTSGACTKTGQRRRKENGIAIKRTNGQRKLEQRTVRMFSATGDLEGWGPSDPRFNELKAALLLFWSEEEEQGWCGKSCCQDIVMAA
jgi:hypothetical protein